MINRKQRNNQKNKNFENLRKKNNIFERKKLDFALI